MRTIFITGGTGLLALNWARVVSDRWSVHLGLHRRQALPAGAKGHTIDLSSPHELSLALDSIAPDLVVHAAGMTNIEACEADPAAARLINVGLAEAVARGCGDRGIRLVHISTDHLFDGTQALVHEDQPVAPLNVYASTKAEAEQRVLEFCSSALILRTNFFGWGTSYRQSFSDTIIGALREQRSITLFEDVFFTPILMDRLVQQAHQLLELGASGIFHAVGDERLSKHGFGLAIAERFGLDQRSIVAGRIADKKGLTRRPLEMGLSNAKARALLGAGSGTVAAQLDQLASIEQAPKVQELRCL